MSDLAGLCMTSIMVIVAALYFFAIKPRYIDSYGNRANPADDVQRITKNASQYISGQDDSEPHMYFSGYAPSVEQKRKDEAGRRYTAESMKRMKGKDE